MRRLFSWATASVIAIPLVLIACGDDDDGGNANTGGATSGGAVNKGGSANKGGNGGASTGGAKTSGGTSAGGSTSMGGASTEGGAPTVEGGTTSNEGGTTAAEGGMTSSEGGATTAEGGMSASEGGMTGAEGGTTGAEGGTMGAEGGAPPAEGGAAAVGGATSAEGGSGGEPGIEADVLNNPGFEDDWVAGGWTITGTTTEVGSSSIVTVKDDGVDKWHAHSGVHYLNMWANTAYTETVSQVVDPLPEGDYSFSVWHYGSAFAAQYVYVKGYNAADPDEMTKLDLDATSENTLATVDTVHVDSGHIEVGAYVDCAGPDECWVHFDDAELTKVE